MTDESPIRVVMVVSLAATADHDRVLDRSLTLTRTLDELNSDGRATVSACCATANVPTTLHRHGVRYDFLRPEHLAAAVAAQHPQVVHVHGTGFVNMLRRIESAVPVSTAIVVQHHGEPPGPWRNRIGHRSLRGRVNGWLFTGAAHGQADPFRRAGIIRRRDRVFDVLEAASLLAPASNGNSAVMLAGTPAVLWVGRLIESKDPVTAIRAFGLAADRLPDAHLHLLATDRALEAEVRTSIAQLGAAAGRVHLHDPVGPEAMPGWYGRADVLLSTSRREGSNYSLIEAMTEGVPPVVTGLPSHRAIVGPLLPTFAVGDAGGAADLLVRAAATDRSDVLARAAHHLTWEVVTGQLLAAYREVLRPLGC